MGFCPTPAFFSPMLSSGSAGPLAQVKLMGLSPPPPAPLPPAPPGLLASLLRGPLWRAGCEEEGNQGAVEGLEPAVGGAVGKGGASRSAANLDWGLAQRGQPARRPWLPPPQVRSRHCWVG